MRDSNPIQQTPIEKLPVYSRHVLLLIYKLLTAIDREKENISFADKELFEDVLHYGTFSRVAELKKMSPYEVSECYNRVVKALEHTASEAQDAPELRKEIKRLEDRILRNEKRLEKQHRELYTLKYEDSKARERGDRTPSDPNLDYMHIKLADLDLPKRFFTRLNRQELFTVGDVLSLSPEYYTRLIGESSLARELKARLEGMGFHVEMVDQKYLEIKTQENLNKDKLEEDIKELKDEIEELKERLAQRDQDVISKDATIKNLRKELKLQSDSLRQSHRESRSKDATIKTLRKDLKDAVDAQIRMSQQIDSKPIESESDKLQHIKKVYDFKLETMNFWKTSLEAELTASRKVINAQQALINRLQSEKENNE